MLHRRNVPFAVGLVFVLLVNASGTAQEKKPDEPTLPKATPEQQKRIDQLIKQLGSEGFTEREQAQQELARIGLPALESLRQAAKDPEVEVSRRAAELVARLEELLAAQKDLAPKKVHLRVQDVSVADAVAELSRLSGYPIRIGGDPAKLKERKITLDTGEVPFWQAFDQLCLKAGLTEISGGEEAGSLQVADGTPKPTPTSYAGAVRLRVVPGSVKRQDGVAEFVLELSIEPRFRQPRVLTAARIDTARDDQDRLLTGLEPPTEKAVRMRAPAALRLAEQSKSLKELSGTVLFETVLADKVLIIDKVPASVGKSVRNDEGQGLRLDGYDKRPNGDIQIRATWSKVMQRNGGAIVINQNTFNEFQPELRDANGLLFQAAVQPAQSITISNMNLSVTRTIIYRPQPGCGEPAELSLSSNRKSALRVPFSFADVPLP
jgi:hypothetical protein